tara:strand:+ start:206 stop:553 length:348 start_codon:yes stop_codon:yes gene_type:complete
MKNKFTEEPLTLEQEAEIFILKQSLENLPKKKIIDKCLKLISHKNEILDIAYDWLSLFHIKIKEERSYIEGKYIKEETLRVVHSSKDIEKLNNKYIDFLDDTFTKDGKYKKSKNK